jgi:hypothetical protein
LEVNLDSRHDLRTAFSFTISASGFKGDEAISGDGDGWDGNWNPIWYAKTSIDESGWIAEMKIPYSQIRFPERDEHVWGIQMTRRIHRIEERSTWQPMPLNGAGWVSYFGEIHGISNIKPRSGFELMPYAVALSQYEDVNKSKFGDPDHELRVGVDGKWMLNNDFAMNFTVNPDFGQVEADPSEINLGAFETYFSEKRPFFVEGIDIFRYPLAQAMTGGPFNQDNLFYSRRIGRSPQLAWWDYMENDEQALDVPGASTILAAFKLTGKTKSGWTVGLIESISEEELVRLRNESGQNRDLMVEPLTHYGVMRLERELSGGNTILGGILTSTNRRLETEELRDRLHRNAFTAGLNLKHFFSNHRKYYLNSRVAISHVNGTKEAISRTQQLPQHYFQRPELKHLSLDETLTSLNGWSGFAHLGRNRGQGKIAWQTGLNVRSPGFESNDIGYLRNADDIWQFAWMGFHDREPRAFYLDWSINFNEWLQWDYNRELLGAAFNVNGSLKLLSQRNFGGSWDWDDEYLDRHKLWGGPAILLPGEQRYGFWMNSPSMGQAGYSTGFNLTQGESDSRDRQSIWADFWIRPLDNLSISLNPSISQSKDKYQYLSTTTGDTNAETYYLLAKLERETFSLNGRIGYFPGPAISLQLYSEVYVSNGEYNQFRRVTSPRAAALANRTRQLEDSEVSYNAVDDVYHVVETFADSYSFRNPDFDNIGINSNLVLRWEYMPGSEIYLVWSSGGWGSLGKNGFKPLKNIFDRDEISTEQVFLLKISRWIDW